MKRAHSQAGSPPPASTPAGPKPKKPRASKPKLPKGAKAAAAAAAAAGSPPPSGSAAPSPFAASSPPAYADSPAFTAARDRSMSVAIDPALGGGAAAAKAKEREDTVGVEGAAPVDGPGPDPDDQDAEDEVLVFSDDEFGSNQRELAKQKEDLRVLLEHFDDEQMARYEAYRRSGLAKGSVRKLVNQVLQQSVSPSILTVVRGFAKVFVGEIVEKARANCGHAGSLTPQDLRDAYRLYLDEHEGAGAGGAQQRKKLFVK